MSLGLVVLLMSLAADPQRWQWIEAPGPPANGDDAPPPPAEPPAPDDIGPAAPADDATPPAGIAFRAEEEFDGPPVLREGPPALRLPGVREDLLGAVRDNTPFRTAEHEAWFHLLDLLARTDNATLREASLGPATFVQIMQQSDYYRGHLVTLRGTARRATFYPSVPANRYGITEYWRVWIEPADSPGNLVTVYCLELPEGFPAGGEIEADVEVTAFYFKRLAYQAQDAIRTAPAFAARTLRWRRPVAMPAPPPQAPALPPVIVGAAALAVLFVIYVVIRTRTPGWSRPATDQVDWRSLEDVPPAPDVAEQLQRLADEDRKAR